MKLVGSAVDELGVFEELDPYSSAVTASDLGRTVMLDPYVDSSVVSLSPTS